MQKYILFIVFTAFITLGLTSCGNKKKCNSCPTWGTIDKVDNENELKRV